jgi:hypothetical protein
MEIFYICLQKDLEAVELEFLEVQLLFLELESFLESDRLEVIG